MSNCNHNCNSCKEKCSTQIGRNLDFIEPLNQFSSIKHVIGVMSGKGGVGKSSVTSMLAVHMQRLGYKVGILDSDITGPSIPKVFGIKEKAKNDESLGIIPVESKNGMKVMSINALLDNEDDPVIWRGPVIAGVVKQFWTDVFWGELDYLFVDMPPGTGDVTLTVFQSIPLDGVVVVTSPQGLVSLIVKKAYNMAEKMNIPVIGIVENMSYVKCPDCDKEIKIYGDSKIEEFAKELNVPVLGKMPLDADIARLCDEGKIEGMACNYLENAAKAIENIKIEGASVKEGFHAVKEGIDTMKVAVATQNNMVAGHFGKCQEYTVFDIENGKVVNKQTLDTKEHGHSKLPPFLKEHGVNVVICGGMGQGAYDALVSRDMKVFVGPQGNIDEVVEKLIQGKLETKEAGCSHHDHEEGHQCQCGGIH